MRLVKRPDQVLSLWKIDPCFAANATIDLGHQTGWHLDETNSSHKGGCSKSCQISNDSPAQSDDDTGTICPKLNHLLPDFTKS